HQRRDARKVVDRLAVDVEQPIADLEACRFRRTVGAEAADHRPDELIDAELAETERVVVLVGALAELRMDLAAQQLLAAAVLDLHRLGPIEEMGLLNVLEAGGSLFTQAHELIARAPTRPGGRTVPPDGPAR